MSEYRRIVSYLYRYNHGKKGENVGYVRVENREDGLRIQFHIHELRNTNKSSVKMYFYIHEEKKTQAFFVDECVLSPGNCEYKNTISSKTELPDLSEIHGVIFMKENTLLYGSCWDDREIIESQIILATDMQEVNTEQSIPAFHEPETVEAKNIPSFNESETIEDENISDPSEPEILKEAEHFSTEEITLESSEVKTPETILLENHDKIDFGDSSSSIQAVKISLPDLHILEDNKNERNISKNPFLLQSYEHYGYLLFGRIQFPGKEPFWILGVPGTYHNREKYLADMYGFTDYIPEKIRQFQTGGRGYWIVML